MFRSAAFFPRINYNGPFGRPLLYLLIISIAVSVVNLFWGYLIWGTLLSRLTDTLAVAGYTPGNVRASLLFQFFLAPFGALLALGVGTLVLHLFALMLAPERRTIGATARVVCYSRGPMLWTIVPIVGVLVGWVWALVLTVQGIRVAHRTTTGRAVAIVLLPWGLFFLFVMVFGFFLVFLLAAAGAGGS